jgi:hypothetical protein
MRTKTILVTYPFPKCDCRDDLVQLTLPNSVTAYKLHTAIRAIAEDLRNDPEVNDAPLEFADALLDKLCEMLSGKYRWIPDTDTIDIGDLMGR